MKQHLALSALLSCLVAAAAAGCGDEDPGSDGSGGDAGSSAGQGSSGEPGNGEGGGGNGGPSEGGADAGGAASLCTELGELCHPFDLGPGPQRDCHELGHSGDAEACEAQESACREACETATEIPFTLDFAAVVGAEPFSCESTYTGLGADDSTVHPVDFRFYVHDVRLLDASGAEVAATLTQDGVWQHEGVALIDFEDRTGECSNGTAETNTQIVGTVPLGEYTGIAFKLGVPFELNHTDAATAPSPLNLSSMFWSWNTGRLFVSLMNSTELDADGRHGTLVHMGSTGCTGDAAAGGVEACSKPNRPEYLFPGFVPGRSVAVADVAAILQNSNLKTDQCHSFQAACAAPFAELGVDFSTGAPTETQSAFRVE